MSAYGGEYDASRVENVEELPGYGISADYRGRRVHIGNLRMMEQQGLSVEQVRSIGTVIYVALEDRYAGYIVIEDSIRHKCQMDDEDAPGAVQRGPCPCSQATAAPPATR